MSSSFNFSFSVTTQEDSDACSTKVFQEYSNKVDHAASSQNIKQNRQAAVPAAETRLQVLDPSTVRNHPQLSYQPYIHNVRKSTSEIAKEKERNPSWPHFKMKTTETTKATINVNPVQVERQVENESVRYGESHTRIPSSTITTDSGFADEPSKMKETTQKPVEIKIGSITRRKTPPPTTPAEKPKININSLRSRAQSPVRKVQEMVQHELPPRTASPTHILSPTRQRKSAGRGNPVSSARSGRQTPDDDACSIKSTDSTVRKISRTGPGRAWYHGYMNNFKGQSGEFNDQTSSVRTSLTDRPQSASTTTAFMSPPAQPRGRSKAFEAAGNKFRDQSVDALFSRNSGNQNEEQKSARMSKGFTGIRRRFAKKSVDDISKENRVSLHESMVRPEVQTRKEEKVQDNADHLELHQSQRINTMRAKSKPQNFSKVRNMWKTGDEKGLRGEREIHPSMVTQDELFLTGGVFASVQDDSDRDGGISSLLLCLRDGFILNFLFDSGELSGCAAYSEISTNDPKGLGSHLILRFDEIVDGDPRIDTELFVQDHHPMVGHLINTFDLSQKQAPGGSLRVFVGDRSIGDGNIRQANIRYPDGSSVEMKNAELVGAFAFLLNRLKGSTVQRAQVSLREVQKTPSAKKSSSIIDPFLALSVKDEAQNDDDVYNLLLRKDRPDLAKKEPQKSLTQIILQ
ncbi:unnamed protein product [Oikopleura dioica]|uniref:Uncharacterized protein n=1 Tax=Oikopleura dioica TaxID=34765 RepID=E4X1J9_OIKDI|nr:unnamed protein product [Oikopleura dioica]